MENAGGGVKAACGIGGNPPRITPMAARDEERDRRLAAALRDNLKRRKAQSREVAAAEAPPPPVRPLPEPN